MGHRKCSRDLECMKALMLAAAVSSNNDKGLPYPPKKMLLRKCKVASFGSDNPFESLNVKMSSDADDDDFIADEQSVSDSESLEAASNIEELTNAEVFFEFTWLD